MILRGCRPKRLVPLQQSVRASGVFLAPILPPRLLQRSLQMRFHPAAAALLLVLASTPALAGSWIESADGDISGNRLSPSIVNITLGNNEVTGTFGSGDVDYLRIDIPAGLQISAINVTSYSGNRVSFVGLQAGTTFSVSPNEALPEDLLGYFLFGNAHLNTNILPAIAAGSGAIGFTPPLNPGNFTLWLQETGGKTGYGLNFVAVPAPGSVALLGLGVLTLGRRRR